MGATTTAITAPPERLQQQLDALARANEIGSQRAKLKRDLKAGRKAIEDVLNQRPEWLASATILDLLIWTPKAQTHQGQPRSAPLSDKPEPNIGALTERQRHIILAELQRPGS
jgi:hypothetical protein